MLFQMAYSVCKVKIFRQRPYVKLGGDLVDALLIVLNQLNVIIIFHHIGSWRQIT